jgi:Putative polyhydroxyalkanoic acid system protein (PHA_gran_rgn)
MVGASATLVRAEPTIQLIATPLEAAMPKIVVRVPHSYEAAAAFAKIQPALDKTVADFQGHSLTSEPGENATEFAFKSMAFTIKGRAAASASDVVVEVELPFAAMMFKDKAERALTKNISRALAAGTSGST